MIKEKYVQWSIGNLIYFIRNWEQNEKFFDMIKNQIIELGNLEYLSYFSKMEDYIRWKGKEDSGNHSGKSMLRISLIDCRNI